MDNQIIDAIYQEEIFVEKRHRITLKDRFFFESLMTPYVIYLAQSEEPIRGEHIHGWALYSISDGKAIGPNTLQARIIFSKLPQVSRLVDVEAPDDGRDDPEYRSLVDTMDRLVSEMQEYHSLSYRSVEEYREYLETMREYRPDALRKVYDFFISNLPEPDPSQMQSEFPCDSIF